MAEITDGKVVPVVLEQEMRNSFLDYAMSVIVDRALPDVRDGLKPVHRRILYGMYESGATPDKPYRKSARIVGDVMGRYHPHGDSSIYMTMVRMAQDFSFREMLVDGHGNFGSIDGDSPAAMRYTEVRMAKLAMEMMADIDKKTVDFKPNFDESLEEPVVLPARFPNLLVNGSEGIAVGMATKIPPHNLGEVIDGTILLIDNPEADDKELLRLVKGPDFPLGATILGREGIRNAYLTGRGSIKVRSKTRIEEMSNGKSRIMVTEIPYQVNKATLIEEIANLVREKTIDGITDLRDESDRNDKVRIVIELRRDVNPNVVLNQLLKHTAMQQSYGVIMLVLVNNEPRILSLREVLHYYLEHQREVVTRRTQFDLAKAEDRAHILEGLRIALDHIDEVIRLIRSSRTVDIAREGLMTQFGLSEKQAQAILEMRLQRLTGLERDKIESEYAELVKLIAYYKDLLADVHKIMLVIKDEMLAIKEKFANPRRTDIVAGEEDFNDEDLIADEDIVVTMTHLGYIKRLPVTTYRNQKRGGRGITGISTKEDDFAEHFFISSTHETLLFFTNQGRVYRLKGYEIPETGRQARGTAIINLIQVEPGERVNAVIPIKAFDPNQYLFMGTRQGVVKKTPLNELDTNRKGGLIGINLDENDELIEVKLTDGNKELIMVTKKGQSIRFPETDVRSLGRTARGVKGITLESDDLVVGMDTVREQSDLVVITGLGMGKRTSLDEYRVQTRGGKGTKAIKLTKRHGVIEGIKVVSENDELMIITAEGIIIRISVQNISQTGRDTQGVRIMKLDAKDRVVTLARVIGGKEEEDTEEPSAE
ncbi:MAG TPA: DNA gyrase subunit A [Firmicutes bacterium]|jgi:DNA gyrase subunit A|nr:DNA gyrase subunit A [Bacillota bacterium]